MQDLLPTAIYVRVSSEMQAGEDRYSIPEQIDRLRKYCDAQGWTIAKEYVDPGHSGSNLKRPAIQELISDTKNGFIRRVVVFKLDRLSRSQRDTMYLIEDVFKAHDVAFVSLSEMFDTSTPFGMAMIGILSVFAQLERENIKDRMSMGRLGRAKRGLWRGGCNTPVGYDFMDGQLVINEYEALQVREIFRLFIDEQLSFHAISREMQGRFTNKYSTYNDSGSISTILRNRLYIGKIKYGTQEFDGQHQPIIDREIFERAQARIEEISRNTGEHWKNPYHGKHLLSGLIWCGNCGARYFCVTTKRKNGPQYRYYQCYTRNGSSDMRKADFCKNPNWRVEKLNAAVMEEIRRLCTDEKYFNRIARDGKKENNNAGKEKALQRELSSIEKQISRLVELYQMGVSVQDIATRIHDAQERRNKLTQELLSLNQQSPKNRRQEALTYIHELKWCLDADDVAAQRRLLDALVNKIVITEGGFEVDWKF